jgi:hypothetical protein
VGPDGGNCPVIIHHCVPATTAQQSSHFNLTSQPYSRQLWLVRARDVIFGSRPLISLKLSPTPVLLFAVRIEFPDRVNDLMPASRRCGAALSGRYSPPPVSTLPLPPAIRARRDRPSVGGRVAEADPLAAVGEQYRVLGLLGPAADGASPSTRTRLWTPPATGARRRCRRCRLGKLRQTRRTCTRVMRGDAIALRSRYSIKLCRLSVRTAPDDRLRRLAQLRLNLQRRDSR